MILHGLVRTALFQNTDYAGLYLRRVGVFAALDPDRDGDALLTVEAARQVALWMCYQDTIQGALQRPGATARTASAPRRGPSRTSSSRSANTCTRRSSAAPRRTCLLRRDHRHHASPPRIDTAPLHRIPTSGPPLVSHGNAEPLRQWVASR
ncbi:DUF6537 domain-containing protein [Nocardia sp. NPDC047654]|jgi:hypothetical protein